jgi:hypothetical protein
MKNKITADKTGAACYNEFHIFSLIFYMTVCNAS